MDGLFVHFGRQSLSRSHLARIKAQLSIESSHDVSVYAEFVHFAQIERPLTDHEEQIARSLLDYGTEERTDVGEATPQCTVVPRLGTISPWSSKATDIFRLCNLHVIDRIERGVRWFIDPWFPEIVDFLHDRMTESVLLDSDLSRVFAKFQPAQMQQIELGSNPVETFHQLNRNLGLALAEDEIEYLVQIYSNLGRAPTDVELMMFAQANSEHCRHKIFNADWLIDGEKSSQSLFQMIRSTTASTNGLGIRSAYEDNASVIDGVCTQRFCVTADTREYRFVEEPVDTLMKVETHNHPTAISPYPGAATGSGGEIRDEGAVGCGSKPKAALVGFTTSHLEIPDATHPWELDAGKPERMASALEIMTDGPIGAAAYNNEYGRPALLGYFRTFEAKKAGNNNARWGYHKPIMIAGGIGSIFRSHIQGSSVAGRCALVVLGGPAMLIGLGGGAASSMSSGQSSEDLDFASVQRDNAELERRCQEVIDRCTAAVDDNPISFIHDVGAGGLSNAFPELIHDLGVGGRFELRDVPNADMGMSPMEIWCNEAQERYVLAIPEDKMTMFEGICERERCPYAIVGHTLSQPRIELTDSLFENRPIDLALDVIFGKPPKMQRAFTSCKRPVGRIDLSQATLTDAIHRILQFPAVASKKFLVTIGDRSITGLIGQEQMVGPFQVPVADAAVTIAGYNTYSGEVMAMGERSPVSTIDPASAARMAIAEALTNLVSARVHSLERVVLSANWMAAAGHEGEDQALHEAVSAASKLCCDLGIAIPVGKDSLSMRTQWTKGDKEHEVVSPVSLIASAFAPVPDVRNVLTPQLRGIGSELLLVELGKERRLGGSALAQVYGQLGDNPPNVDDAAALASLVDLAKDVLDRDLALSMHDRSDGGLFTTVVEMSIAGRIGLSMELSGSWQEELFAEEVGLVFESVPSRSHQITDLAGELGLICQRVATTTDDENIAISFNGKTMYRASIVDVERQWSRTSYLMQRLRDDDDCADSEHGLIGSGDAGLSEQLTFAIEEPTIAETGSKRSVPRVAILRDQGVNGQVEMAAAFHAAGFACDDVHMTDLFEGRVTLNDYQVLAACGGFSYGDVLGAGGGWAKSILFNDRVRSEFQAFFERSDSMTLGVCNGCQMLARLHSLIPGSDHWPTFERNQSDQFEGRTIQVRVEKCESPWIGNMTGSQIPVPVAHGEGRALFDSEESVKELKGQGRIAFRYVDGQGNATNAYPLNPNGSWDAIAGTISADGRVLILMPHPERVYRTIQNSWVDPALRSREFSPWFQLFRNAWNAVS